MQGFRSRLASLNRRGIRLYLMFPPYKENIYREKLPFWLRVQPETELDRLLDALKAAGLDDHLIDVRKQLLAEKRPSKLLYYKFDTHWNSQGAYVGYRQLIIRIHEDFPEIEPLPIEAFPLRERAEDANLAFMLGVRSYLNTICRCGAVDFLRREEAVMRCNYCAIAHPISLADAIDFVQKSILFRRRPIKALSSILLTPLLTYKNSAALSLEYLKMCGHDPAHLLANLSVLDVACGAGWVTAGLLQYPAIRNCRFQAFDISHGLESLARFQRTIESTNELEMSVQDAARMGFANESFDTARRIH